MAATWLNKLRGQFAGGKQRWRQRYVTATTPGEVQTANQLKQDLPTNLATYIYSAGYFDNTNSLTLGGYVVLKTKQPAQQDAAPFLKYSSAYEGELASLVKALEGVPVVQRQSGLFVLVTHLNDLVREHNDFSLAANYSYNDQGQFETTVEELKHELMTLVMTFSNLRMVSYQDSDRAKADFLKQKLQRIQQVYRTKRGK